MAPRLVTIGVIAKELNQPLHRVSRILATRKHIQPSAFAGNVRLYRQQAIAQVRHALNAVDARRSSSLIRSGQ